MSSRRWKTAAGAPLRHAAALRRASFASGCETRRRLDVGSTFGVAHENFYARSDMCSSRTDGPRSAAGSARARTVSQPAASQRWRPAWRT